MDWITTSGASVHEAKSNALDQLGIVADEAEFEVINDVDKGLFGRVKTSAKVRARVKPKQPVIKDERRRRSGGSKSGNGSKGSSRGGRDGGRKDSARKDGARKDGGGRDGSRRDRPDSKSKQNDDGRQKSSSKSDSGRGGRGNQSSDDRQNDPGKSESKRYSNGSDEEALDKSSGKTDKPSSGKQKQTKRDNVDHDFSRQQQTDVAKEFLEGLLTSFEMEGTVAVVEELAEDEAIELTVTGSELGLLVGPKGVTLNAVQELTRTVVQREADGAKTERLRVDVAAYRERRRAALQKFAQEIAADVVNSGDEKVMEPMGPADRKVVHDALTDVDGVQTGSEGEEPRRRVVIRPT